MSISLLKQGIHAHWCPMRKFDRRLLFCVFRGKCTFRLRTQTNKVEIPRELLSRCLQFVGGDFGSPVMKAIRLYFGSPVMKAIRLYHTSVTLKRCAYNSCSPGGLRLLLEKRRFPQALLNECAKHTWSQPAMQFQLLLAGARVSEDMYCTRFNRNLTSRRLLKLALSCWWNDTTPRITEYWNYAMTRDELKARVDYAYERVHFRIKMALFAKWGLKKLQLLGECQRCECTQ